MLLSLSSKTFASRSLAWPALKVRILLADNPTGISAKPSFDERHSQALDSVSQPFKPCSIQRAIHVSGVTRTPIQWTVFQNIISVCSQNSTHFANEQKLSTKPNLPFNQSLQKGGPTDGGSSRTAGLLNKPRPYRGQFRWITRTQWSYLSSNITTGLTIHAHGEWGLRSYPLSLPTCHPILPLPRSLNCHVTPLATLRSYPLTKVHTA